MGVSKKFRYGGLLISLLFVALALVTVANRQAIQDWWQLRQYSPSAEVEAIASTTGLSDEGRRLFYLGSPSIENRESFNQHCSGKGERSIVLGCYNGRYIYIYNVTDERLSGVKEVTAVHEMLHVAYGRLSTSDREEINQLLENQFNAVTDERVKQLVDEYRRTSPEELLNEMHSIFGTELVDLNSQLEEYYSRYFTNRQVIVGIAKQYESIFVENRQKIDALDRQMQDLQATIEANEQTLEAQRAAIDAESARLEQLREGDDVEAYNAAVAPYNQQVQQYNTLLNEVRGQVDHYNTLVKERNELAASYNDLAESLDSSAPQIEE